MSTYYTFCEKCDFKIVTSKEALIKGVVCPECGDRFSPKKLNRVDKPARDIALAAAFAFIVGAALTVISIFEPGLTIIGGSVLGTGLILFVIVQLLYIRAALEKLSGK